MKSSAIIARRHGGPEVLEYGEIDVGEPGPGELRIVQNAIGPKVAGIATVRPDNVAPD